MAIKQYSLAKDGAKQLSPAFKVREFRCRDGSDAIMIDQTLVVLLHCLLYTSPSPRDMRRSRMPSSA